MVVEFLQANAPHQPGDRASLPRSRAAALITAGVARLPPDLAEAPAEPAPAPALGSGPAIRTTALRRGTRKAATRT